MVILASMIPRTFSTYDHISSIAKGFTSKGYRSTCVENVSIRIPSVSTAVRLELLRNGSKYKTEVVQRAVDESPGELSDEDDDELCPVECVKEFKTDEELAKILEKAKKSKALVVVDFYRTSCGSCKYIAQGFTKICKGAGQEDAPVIFLKHNVMDEYEEQSEVAERLRIKTVPLFHFYKDGVLLESFPTRDKERITEAIRRYTSPVSQES